MGYGVRCTRDRYIYILKYPVIKQDRILFSTLISQKCFTDERIKRIFMKRLNRILLTLLIAIPPTIITEAQQAHVNLDWAPQKNRQNLVPFSASVNSPEVTDDHMCIMNL